MTRPMLTQLEAATACGVSRTTIRRRRKAGGRGAAQRGPGELERERQDHALAVAAERHGRELAEAEAAPLRERLGARAEHIADLQQALRALTPAPVCTELLP
ncbi:hypothetical protein ACIOHR_37710 [Streptomyces anulatus]